MKESASLVELWLATTRPKTLFAALSPVLMGGALRLAEGPVHFPVWFATLGVALLIQIGTNFCNDVFDHKQGADTEARQGPLRGLHSGRISLRAMSLATVACFGSVALISALLIRHGGMPVVWLAVASIFCGVFYTAGRWSLAYTGLADLFVIVFFGPVAVAGTYYLQFPASGWPPLPVYLAGLGPGLIATSLLTVNNLRDVDEDTENHKRTLAVRFGRRFSRIEYTVCMLGALVAPVMAAGVAGRGWGSCLVLCLFPLMLPLIRQVQVGTTGAELNPVLGKTGKILLMYAVLFSVTWPWGG
ncbi:1,4-dihydroxy-2-naphthoate octaprenyltransferase [Kiritimatiellaeota bacterium B1221]|nr:1,4-dihydroxy-2-naphthoate octaprenyltransferase [Kiritimatiellaeota bacterium B1221]